MLFEHCTWNQTEAPQPPPSNNPPAHPAPSAGRQIESLHCCVNLLLWSLVWEPLRCPLFKKSSSASLCAIKIKLWPFEIRVSQRWCFPPEHEITNTTPLIIHQQMKHRVWCSNLFIDWFYYVLNHYFIQDCFILSIYGLKIIIKIWNIIAFLSTLLNCGLSLVLKKP